MGTRLHTVYNDTHLHLAISMHITAIAKTFLNSSHLFNYTVLEAKQLVAGGTGFQDDTFPTVEELTNTSFEVSAGMVRIPGSLLEEIAQDSNCKPSVLNIMIIIFY